MVGNCTRAPRFNRRSVGGTARTGMPPEQMTCAIPADRLREVVERLEATVALDPAMGN
jgi:hypothetical protein